MVLYSYQLFGKAEQVSGVRINNMSNRIAYCIATYERPEVIDDFLEKNADIYLNNNIDIFIFDSSRDDDTKIRIEDHGLSGVYYIKVSSEVGLSEKVFKIINGEFFWQISDYDYVWLSNDANQFQRNTIEMICDSLERKEYDIAIVSIFFDLKDDIKEYEEQRLFFLECAYKTTLLGSVIISTHTMLRDVDWEKYWNAFMKEPYKTWMINNFYFHRIIELDKFAGIYFPHLNNGIKYSLKKKAPHWYQFFYDVLCDKWVKTITNMPDCYGEVNKRIVCLKNPFFMISEIEDHYARRRRGIYSLLVFLKYYKEWEKVTLIPRRELLKIAMTPRILLQLRYQCERIKLKHMLIKFCRSFECVYISGMGDNAFLMKQLLELYNIRILGLCATKKEKDICWGYSVFAFDEIKSNNCGFIVSMMENNAKEVIPSIVEKYGRKSVFWEPYLVKHTLSEELGYRS